MTKNEFIIECNEMLIDPAIAFECEAVQDAIKTGNIDNVVNALGENF